MNKAALIIVSIVIVIAFSSCDDLFNGGKDDVKIVTVTLDAAHPFYHFETGLVYAADSMPSDIDDMGIINEPWCTDLPALCGNIAVSDKSSFDDFEKIPYSKYENTCEEISLNKVVVFKIENGTYALVKITHDDYTSGNNGCEHKVTLQIQYPALEDLKMEEEVLPSGISNGTWELAAQTSGLSIYGLSSFNRYGSSVYIAGYITSSQYAGHIGEIVYESNTYRSQIYTPQNVNCTDISCVGDSKFFISSYHGKMAMFNTLGNKWGELNDVPNESNTTDIWAASENVVYVSANKKLHRTTDAGENWSTINLDDFGDYKVGQIAFSSETTGIVLRTNATDIGTYFRTWDGITFYKYEFPIHWYGQPSVTKLRNVCYADADHAWICADYGQIIHSTDAGQNWQIQRHGGENEAHLYDIDFSNNNEGWACGSGGTLLHTINGGETWEKVDIEETNDLIALDFNGPYCGWVATSSKVYFYNDWDQYVKYFN